MSKVRIERICVKDLHAFAADFLSRSKSDEVIPISLQRAIAHSQNPCAEKDDVGLLVAFLDGKCVGFQGILPSRLKTFEGSEKIYWISGLYIHPGHRGSSVYLEILKAQIALNYDCFYTGLSQDITSVLRGMRMNELAKVRYCHLDLDGLADVLNLPIRILNKGLGRVDEESHCSSSFIGLTRDLISGHRQGVYEYLSELNEPLLEGKICEEVQEIPPDEYFHVTDAPRFERDISTINWMLKIPWFNESDGDYYFGQKPHTWGKHMAIQVLNAVDRSSLGFVVLYFLSIHGKILVRVVDWRFRCEKDWLCVFPIALRRGREMNAEIIDFSKALPLGKFGITKHVLLRCCDAPCFYHLKKNSRIESYVCEIHRDLGDGDTAFA